MDSILLGGIVLICLGIFSKGVDDQSKRKKVSCVIFGILFCLLALFARFIKGP
jgi:hypothetical protein